MSATAVKAYKKRFGTEAMFRDCKTGGYNLEGSQASPDKLVRLMKANCNRNDQCLVTRGKNQYFGKNFLCLPLKRNGKN
jgi:hypothetical protein